MARVQDGRAANTTPVATRFQPGNQAGGGRKLGSRDRITRRFLLELAEDFDANGAAAIRACRIDEPATYLRVVAGLLPREVEIVKPLGSLSDDELADAIATVRAMAGGQDHGASGDAPGGTEAKERPKRPRRIQALSQAD